ncbi:hypothetical protein [Streptomyces sp. AC627_RSS907]|uniref:hypothetical protein n=1 Tax=Streptomyces sp. AC627_RSS907 TaxID=2823684 RepID=UPI0035B2509B
MEPHRTAPHRGDVGGEPVVGFGSTPGGKRNETPGGDRLTMDLGITAPPGPYGARPPDHPASPSASVPA